MPPIASLNLSEVLSRNRYLRGLRAAGLMPKDAKPENFDGGRKDLVLTPS